MDVPRTTLKDHLRGRVAHSTKPGPVKYLNEDERALSDHLINPLYLMRMRRFNHMATT